MHTYIYIYICMYVYIYIYICTRMCVHIRYKFGIILCLHENIHNRALLTEDRAPASLFCP